MKVGVFGGTFDPVHIGHLVAAQEARVRLDLDEVVFIPAGQPWLKAGMKITAGSHRMAMVDLAIASNASFRSSPVDMNRPGPTYTVDTLVEMRRRLGREAGLYIIVGLDSLTELDRWHAPERIFELGTVVGVTRPGFQDFDLRALDVIAPGASTKVTLVDGPLVDVSGREIRRRVSEGLPIKYWVPEPVEAYIYTHGLYEERGLPGR